MPEAVHCNCNSNNLKSLCKTYPSIRFNLMCDLSDMCTYRDFVCVRNTTKLCRSS